MDEKGKPVFNFSVLDGKQRLTNVLSYLNGEYALSQDIPDITIEDEIYSIAGKYFVDQDSQVQYEILHYKFEIVTFEDCTNSVVEEIFFRLNNSVPLTKSQVAKAKVGVELAELLNELLASKFFTESCNFSKAQIKGSDNQRCLLQSMMLLDTNYVPDYELKDFSENSILEYAESIKGNYSDMQTNVIRSAVQFLGDAFPEKNKEIRKITVPMLMYIADVAQDKSIKPMYFRQWFEWFSEEEELWAVYKSYGSSGSTKLEKVKGRLAIMAKSFANYFETEVPEELKDIVSEVETKLEAENTPEEEDVTTEQEEATENDVTVATPESEDVIEEVEHIEETGNFDTEEGPVEQEAASDSPDEEDNAPTDSAEEPTSEEDASEDVVTI